MKPLNKNFISLQQKVDGLLTKASNMTVADVVQEIVDKIGILKHEISDVPMGMGSAEPLHLTYTSPINSSPSS